MKLCTSLVILTFIVSISFGQKIPLDQFKSMTMREIGPATTGGRVTSIDVKEGSNEVIYAGTAAGGLWKSNSHGLTWEPIFDDQAIIGIGSVKMDPSNTDIVWVGTGEGNPRNSQTGGRGIYRSPDGGHSWKCMGLEKTFSIHRIAVDPRNSDIVYAGSPGNAWSPSPDRGVYKTTDQGATWKKILFVNDSVGCADLVMDQSNSNKLFAAMWQYGRKPWFFNSGGKGSGLYMTLDGGTTWKQLTEKEGLPEGELGRIGIAISPSNPKVVYALIEGKKTGLYKSVDGGFQWSLINSNDVDDRPFYYHELYVDPSNENHLMYLHSTVSESIDGGVSWKTLLPYYGVHPDHHAFWWSSSDPSFMLEGNDGGLNISEDGGRNWRFINNLPLGQFYHINYDLDTPYHVYGGMQDNGSWKGPAYAWHEGGIISADWHELYFGDGFDVLAKPNNSRYVYAMSQGGEVSEIDTETGGARYIKPVETDSVKLRFNWNAAIAQDPSNDCGLYFGSQFLHHSDNCGSSWKVISPDLTTNDKEKQKQALSGGLTIDATAAENHCTILSIAPSSIDTKVIWVGTDDGNLQLTKDCGANWMKLSDKLPGAPKGAWIPQIVASSFNASEAFVVLNNYRQGDSRPFIFHTTDFGKSWKNIVDEKQIDGHCLSIVQDHIQPKLLFAGSEHGLYVSIDYGVNWTKWTENYPNVATQDLKIHPIESDLIIGTFGRSAYILDDISPLRKLATEGLSLLDKKLVAMPTPVAYMADYERPLGERFAADAAYEGDNRQGGAALSYYFKVDTKKDDESSNAKGNDKKENIKVDSKDKKDKARDKMVNAIILSSLGDTLRIIKQEPDSGYNRIYWGFDTKGIFWPSRGDRKERKEQPGGGPQVAPGMYKVVFSFNSAKDSTVFEVKSDPRKKFSEVGYDQYVERSKKLMGIAQQADSAFEALKGAMSTLSLVRSTLVNVPDSLKKEVLSQADSLETKMGDLQKLFMQPRDLKGIRDNSNYLMSKLWNVAAYLQPGDEGSYGNADRAFAIAMSSNKEVIEKVNAFFENEWMKWQQNVEALDKPLFKPYKKL